VAVTNLKVTLTWRVEQDQTVGSDKGAGSTHITNTYGPVLWQFASYWIGLGSNSGML
jgi:hypothetical protein